MRSTEHKMRIVMIDTMDFLQHQLESATFWFGQAMYLSKNNTRDVIKLAECLILRKQFHRASTLLKQQGLDQGAASKVFI